jgi:hypothetical protein
MDTILKYRADLLKNVSITIQSNSSPCVWLQHWHIVFSAPKVELPLEKFPVVALTERGLTSKWSWYTVTNEILEKGLEEYNDTPSR